ncbi:hypothetical protein COHA_000926 [Chlorella ohadii]|uniref:C2 domain-containing protein n=1 Tax=Chlorella ohadii TaxID=2649997 RepID=A0AAD5DZK9_9CHLO|nr:hypothetical protein COHA_000926 [Chlorella ohadii]
MSVEDKQAAGTLSQASNGFQQDAAAAVAQMLGPGTSALVEISVKCKGLPDRDVLSKSDAMAVLLAGDGYNAKAWSEVGRTDTVCNSLNPEFRKPLRATYNFEKLQPMRLAVYDVDVREKDNRKLKLAEQASEAAFLLSDLLTASGQTLALPLKDAHGRPLPGCTAVLSAEELPNTNAVVTLALAAQRLENKDTFGKSDPFLKISKARENGAWAPVVKSEVVSNNLNPTWRPLRVSMASLCHCDEARPLLIEVYDHDAGGSHDLIGRAEASLAQLQAAAAQGQALPLVNPRKQGSAGYSSSGALLVKSVTVTPRPSFLDYIRGGVELSFIVGIDYTASNGDPRDPASLHYFSQRPTIYEDAISAVGRVLEFYDKDKHFPTYGFGAVLPPNNVTSHCFPVNGNAHNPEVAGVQGILQAYRQALSTVRLSGPTLFAPIINQAAQIAAQPSATPKYWVLLILTDGCIMDMANTLQAVVSASQLPLSLLIVGVGNEDFAAMEALDSDKKRLRAPSGQQAARDIVQFCELRPHQRDTVEGLASKLLGELPGQVVEYFHELRRMPPPGRPQATPGATPAAPPPAVAAQAAAAQPAASYPAYPTV